MNLVIDARRPLTSIEIYVCDPMVKTQHMDVEVAAVSEPIQLLAFSPLHLDPYPVC